MKKPPKKNLRKALQKRLFGAKKVVLLGIGSELMGDDAAGIIIAEKLNKAFKASKTSKKFKALLGSTAPENFTGEIKKFKPSHLVIVDCADMKCKPGEAVILDPDKITGISFSTHRLPISIMMRYLSHFVKCELVVIGIQPKSLKFGQKPSKEVAAAINSVSEAILASLRHCEPSAR